MGPLGGRKRAKGWLNELMRCPECGAELEVPRRFCGYCGTDLHRHVSPVDSSGGSVGLRSQPVLTMIAGSELDRQFPLSGVVYVGREGDSEIIVNDPRVSRRHARLRADGHRVTITDLGSTNGTYVNEVLVSGEQVLYDGDVIRMGRTEWTFSSGRAGAAPRMPRRTVVSAGREPVFSRAHKPARLASEDIVEPDELPWSAIAIVVGGLIIGLSICCIAAVFLLSR